MLPLKAASGEMYDGGARVAPEAPVRDEGHLFVKPHTGNGGGGGEHLPHTGAACRAFVADDYHVSRDDFAAEDGSDGLLLRVKHPSRSLMHQHILRHGATLDDGTLGSEGAEQNRKAPRLGVGIFNGADDVVVNHLDPFEVFTEGLARGGNDGGVQQSLIMKLCNDGPHAAGGIEVLQVVLPRRSQLTEVRRGLAHFVYHIEVKGDARLMGDGGQVQDVFVEQPSAISTHGRCGKASFRISGAMPFREDA